jgi:hypothetical protein
MRNQMGTEGSRGREGHHTDAGDSGASIVVSPRLSCVWGVGGPQPPPLKSDGGCEARLWCMLNDCGKDSGNVGGSKCGNAKRDPDGDCESGMIQSCLKRGESGSVSRDSMEFMSRLPMEFLRKGLQAIGLAPPERDERSLGEKVRAGQYVPIAPHYSAELHNPVFDPPSEERAEVNSTTEVVSASIGESEECRRAKGLAAFGREIVKFHLPTPNGVELAFDFHLNGNGRKRNDIDGHKTREAIRLAFGHGASAASAAVGEFLPSKFPLHKSAAFGLKDGLACLYLDGSQTYETSFTETFAVESDAHRGAKFAVALMFYPDYPLQFNLLTLGHSSRFLAITLHDATQGGHRNA